LRITYRCASRDDSTARFPEAEAMMRDASPPTVEGSAIRLETKTRSRRAWRALGVTSARLVDARTFEIAGVRIERDEDFSGDLRGNVVRYRGETERFVFARGAEIEELAMLPRSTSIAYRFDRSTLRALSDTIVEVTDGAGSPVLRMRADKAWDADGETIPVKLTIDRDVVRASVDEHAKLPVMVDPTWAAATSPSKARAGHTATLLGDGRVLLAGGAGAQSDTADIYDSRTGIFTALEPRTRMVAKRTHHTATMLANGNVLLAGGDGPLGTAEIFDPRTDTFTATGNMVAPRELHAAARLPSGGVLVKGGAGPGATSTEIYDPQAGTFALTQPGPVPGNGVMVALATGKVLYAAESIAAVFDPSGPSWTSVPAGLTFSWRPRAAALLPDGRVFVTATEDCPVPTSGPINCSTTAQQFDPVAGTFGAASPSIPPHGGATTATVLPSGKVLMTGGFISTTASRIFDPAAGTGTLDDAETLTPHRDQTATILPGGDVLVIGGDQIGADVRTWIGTMSPTASKMTAPRYDHGVQRLRNGKVLLLGGAVHAPTALPSTYASSELYDPVARTFAASGTMTTPREGAAVAMLPSGKVLVAGGREDTASKASAELYDPGNGQFAAVGSLTSPRYRHAAAHLPDGKILVAGGCTDVSKCVATSLRTADVFDPVSETFQATGAMLTGHVELGLVPLPNGLVLVIGGLADASAEIYDPKLGTFRATNPPTVARDGRTAGLLPSGRVFVSGGATLANEVFDPATETWSAAPGITFAPTSATWSIAAVGSQLLMSGGQRPNQQGAESRIVLLDLLAPANGSTILADGGLGTGRKAHATSLVDTGVLVTGGDGSGGGVLGVVRDTAYVYSDGALASARPVLATAPAKVGGGEVVTITGHRFASGETPLAFWVPAATPTIVSTRITDFTDSSATWIAPATAFHGHGWLHVVASGLPSTSLPVEIDPGQSGAVCRFDAECASAFCSDGVCCNARCDAVCEGCTQRRKGSGDDGTCGAVTPGKDPVGKCVLERGAECTSNEQCAPGTFCAQGVCCNNPCTDACLSCALPATRGTCSVDDTCGCDGDHTLKQGGQPDIDCAPFKCAGAACRTECVSVRDCVVPTVCDRESKCVPPPNVAPANESLFGCASSGRPAGSAAVLGALVALALALLKRRG
jgi:hypothetical protein